MLLLLLELLLWKLCRRSSLDGLYLLRVAVQIDRLLELSDWLLRHIFILSAWAENLLRTGLWWRLELAYVGSHSSLRRRVGNTFVAGTVDSGKLAARVLWYLGLIAWGAWRWHSVWMNHGWLSLICDLYLHLLLLIDSLGDGTVALLLSIGSGSCICRLIWTWFVQTGEAECLDPGRAIMSFKLNLDFLWVFQVIDYHLSSLLSANTDCMSIGAERDGSQRWPNLDLFDLLSFNNIIEEDTAVETCRAQEKIVNRRERNTGAHVVMVSKFESKRVLLWTIIGTHTSALVNLDYLL